MFDWKYELQLNIDVALDPAVNLDQRDVCALAAGRIILFAQEDLCEMEYEYVLHALRISKEFANVYRTKYIASIGRLLRANS